MSLKIVIADLEDFVTELTELEMEEVKGGYCQYFSGIQPDYLLFALDQQSIENFCYASGGTYYGSVQGIDY